MMKWLKRIICKIGWHSFCYDLVEHDGYLNTAQAGDYELRFYIYSRVTASSAFRTMRIHVE